MPITKNGIQQLRARSPKLASIPDDDIHIYFYDKPTPEIENMSEEEVDNLAEELMNLSQ